MLFNALIRELLDSSTCFPDNLKLFVFFGDWFNDVCTVNSQYISKSVM